jgi:hypothetical protein
VRWRPGVVVGALGATLLLTLFALRQQEARGRHLGGKLTRQDTAAPLGGAEAVLVDFVTRAEVLRSTVDASGEWELFPVPDGVFDLRWVASPFAPVELERLVTAGAGSRLRIDRAVPANATSLTVLVQSAETGHPIPGVTVKAVSAPEAQPVATDDRGECVLRGVPEGPVALLLSQKGMPDTFHVATPAGLVASELVALPQEAFAVEGELIDSGGAPMPETELRYTRAPGASHAPALTQDGSVRTDAWGKFRLRLPRAEWLVGSGHLSVDRDLLGVRVGLKPPSTNCLVLDATGVPAPRAVVRFFDGQQQITRVSTDGAGRASDFAMLAMLGGRAVTEVRADDVGASGASTLPAGWKWGDPCEVRLGPRSTVTVRIEPPTGTLSTIEVPRFDGDPEPPRYSFVDVAKVGCPPGTHSVKLATSKSPERGVTLSVSAPHSTATFSP